MQTKVFAIFDVKAKSYGQPFFVPHNGIALRMFSDLVVDDKSSISKHPEDYKLYYLGEYDDVAGNFTSVPTPDFLANASDFTK